MLQLVQTELHVLQCVIAGVFGNKNVKTPEGIHSAKEFFPFFSVLLLLAFGEENKTEQNRHARMRRNKYEGKW